MRVYVALLLAAGLPAQEAPTVTFGTTVTASSGFKGDVYLLRNDQEDLPNFKRMKPVGAVYTTSLHITPRQFDQGFPGITERFEWFGIDYNGRVWIEQEGHYRFRLLADDGAKLWINGKLVVDNDGQHAATSVEGSCTLTRGIHTFRIGYFQGPRFLVALVLDFIAPGQTDWKIFDTNLFPAPQNPAEWVNGTIRQIKAGSNWD